MRALPTNCKDINAVGSFCDCVREDGSADIAAQAFCRRADAGEKATGDELVELKKALTDLEDDSDEEGCCCGC